MLKYSFFGANKVPFNAHFSGHIRKVKLKSGKFYNSNSVCIVFPEFNSESFILNTSKTQQVLEIHIFYKILKIMIKI